MTQPVDNMIIMNFDGLRHMIRDAVREGACAGLNMNDYIDEAVNKIADTVLDANGIVRVVDLTDD